MARRESGDTRRPHWALEAAWLIGVLLGVLLNVLCWPHSMMRRPYVWFFIGLLVFFLVLVLWSLASRRTGKSSGEGS